MIHLPVHLAEEAKIGGGQCVTDGCTQWSDTYTL
jgi:hypothetical protein